MASVKRHHLNGRGYWNEDSTGEWVKFVDVKAVVEEAYENGKKVGYEEGSKAASTWRYQ